MPQKTKPQKDTKQPTLDIPHQSLSELFHTVAKKNKDKHALFFKGKFKTYAEVEEEVNRLSNSLQKLGIKKGDRVAVLLPNCPQFITAFFAVQSLGAIFTAFNPMYSAREIKHRLNDSQPKIFIMLNLFLDKIKTIEKEISVDHIIITSVARELPTKTRYIYKLMTMRKNIPLEKGINYSALLKEGENKKIDTPVNPEEDIAMLQYTGGTTGKPKGAMLTHKNLIAQTAVLRYWVTKLEKQPKGQKKVAGVLPYSHIFGLTSSFLWPISLGATTYLVPDPRKLEEVMKIIDNHGIHFLNCVPVFFQKFATHKNLHKYDLSSLYMNISGGESLPKETVTIFEKNVGSLLIEGYGLTEASPVTHINPPNKAERKIGSIGVTIPNTKTKIVNTETQKEITIPGSSGELLIKGPSVMKGYWNSNEETENPFQNGWLRTGDVVTKDENGYFTIIDRLKDMIIVSGYKVWPNEVEEILLTHPSILEAAVVGIKTKIGTKLKATIVKKEEGQTLTIDELRTYCKKFLAPYKVPRLIEYQNELPRSSVGKVLRRELRGDAAE